jgi:hypothetical protein
MVKLSMIPLPMSRRTAVARWSTWIVGVEALLLTALGAAALAQTRLNSHREAAVLGLQLDLAHSLLLIITGVLAFASLSRPIWLIAFTGVQALAYPVVLHVATLTTSNTLDKAELHLGSLVLYGALFALGLALWFALFVDAYRQRRPGVSKQGWKLWWPD